jgi:hypothetical protein
MPFIRLSDNYIDHPKFLALSAQAFRLWHEGMAFCRKHQTDGLIPNSALQGFRYHKSAWALELATPYQPDASPLWEKVAIGFKVHDYLFWNLSKQEEQAEREAATARMRKLRKDRRDATCSDERSLERSLVRSDVRSPYVPDRIGTSSKDPNTKNSEREFEGKPETIELRAGHLVEKYGELYIKHRFGAKHKQRPNLDWHEAQGLCELWDDARLEKLAVLVLTTDDPWISKTDRSFKIFAMKATWADDRLKAWEVEHGVLA